MLIQVHHSTCDISHSCQEVKRLKDLKTFSKKVKLTLDTFDNVIYVTRITTANLAVFVRVSACNPSIGQGYAHQLKGEKAMKNKNASVSANTKPVADGNGNINCTNCVNCKNCADCVNCSNCTDCTDCVDCNNCKDCKDCKNCVDCDDCQECIGCADCTDCRNCGVDRTSDSDENEVGAE